MPIVTMLLAHRVDERAAELAELRARRAAASPSCGSPAAAARGTFQTSFTPSAHVCGLVAREPELLERRAGQMALRPLGEDRHPRADVRAGLEARRAPRRRARAPCRRCARRRRAPSVDEQLLGRVSGSTVAPSPSASLRRASRPSCESDTTTLPWFRIVGGVGIRHARVARQEAAPPRRAPRRRGKSSTADANSRRRPRGLTTAPESRCEPGALPFSSTATGTSPSRSAVSGRPRRAARAGSPPRARPARRRRPGRRPRSARRRIGRRRIASAADHGGGKSAGRTLTTGARGRARSASGRSRAGRRRRRGRRTRRSARSGPC